MGERSKWEAAARVTRRRAAVSMSVVVSLLSCAPTPGAAAPNSGAQEASPQNASTHDASPPAAASSAPPPAPSTASDVLESGRGPFDACYARARASDPNLGRTWIEITFDIEATGTPRTVDLHYRNRIDDTAKECMRDAALALRFPPSMAGSRTGKISFTPPPSAR